MAGVYRVGHGNNISVCSGYGFVIPAQVGKRVVFILKTSSVRVEVKLERVGQPLATYTGLVKISNGVVPVF